VEREDEHKIGLAQNSGYHGTGLGVADLPVASSDAYFIVEYLVSSYCCDSYRSYRSYEWNSDYLKRGSVLSLSGPYPDSPVAFFDSLVGFLSSEFHLYLQELDSHPSLALVTWFHSYIDYRAAFLSTSALD